MKDYDNERLVFFSDAVIAITITLLVLEIKVPSLAETATDADLASVLRESLGHFRGYFISFAVIGSFWLSHHQKFKVITRSSRILMVLNLLFLAFIGIVPFVTGLIAENPGVLATQLYAATMAICALSLSMMWLYAVLAGLVHAGVDRGEQWMAFWISLASVVVFVLSMAIAEIDADWAKWSWMLLVPLAILRRSRLVGAGND